MPWNNWARVHQNQRSQHTGTAEPARSGACAPQREKPARVPRWQPAQPRQGEVRNHQYGRERLTRVNLPRWRQTENGQSETQSDTRRRWGLPRDFTSPYPPPNSINQEPKYEKQPRRPFFFFAVCKSLLHLWPHGLQRARLPHLSPSPGVRSNSCPLSQFPSIMTLLFYGQILQI